MWNITEYIYKNTLRNKLANKIIFRTTQFEIRNIMTYSTY